jgi:hypothetical protein
MIEREAWKSRGTTEDYFGKNSSIYNGLTVAPGYKEKSFDGSRNAYKSVRIGLDKRVEVESLENRISLITPKISAKFIGRYSSKF